MPGIRRFSSLQQLPPLQTMQPIFFQRQLRRRCKSVDCNLVAKMGSSFSRVDLSGKTSLLKFWAPAITSVVAYMRSFCGVSHWKNLETICQTHLCQTKNCISCFLPSRHLQPAWNLPAIFIRWGGSCSLLCAPKLCEHEWLLPWCSCRNWQEKHNLRLEECNCPAPRSPFKLPEVMGQLGSIWWSQLWKFKHHRKIWVLRKNSRPCFKVMQNPHPISPTSKPFCPWKPFVLLVLQLAWWLARMLRLILQVPQWDPPMVWSCSSWRLHIQKLGWVDWLRRTRTCSMLWAFKIWIQAAVGTERCSPSQFVAAWVNMLTIAGIEAIQTSGAAILCGLQSWVVRTLLVQGTGIY